MPKSKNVYSELAMYSEKITKEDYKRLFDTIIKKNIPLFEFIDLSKIFSFSGFQIVVKRFNNTIKMYFGGRSIDAHQQAALFFPFKIDAPKELELNPSHFSLKTKFVSHINMFDFLIKEDVAEIRVKIMKLFGKYYGFGNFITQEGDRGILYLSNPTTFFEIDLEKNPQFYIELLDPIPKAVYLKSDDPIFEQDGITIGTDNFSAMQHSLIVGSSGTGKSKFIEILIRAMKKRHGHNLRVLVIDPHGEFSKTFEGEKVVDFVENYIEPFDIGKEKSPLITQLVAQLITSTISQENKYAERVVFYAVHMLAETDQLTLQNINLLLTDSAKRMEFSSACHNDEVRRFFDEEFQNIYLHHFNDAILPVINFIGEYQLYLGKAKKLETLEELLKNNVVTVVSFNPHFFGRKIIRFFAGAIINQIYMMAISEKLTMPTVLMVDEFPTVESRVTKDILAETRKFQLYMHVSAQYLGQLSKPVLDAIVSNVRNIISFKCTRDDAHFLVSMMEIKVEEFFKKKTSPSELEESKKEMFLKLHPRECIVRLFDGAKYILPMKVKTVDLDIWRNMKSSNQRSSQSPPQYPPPSVSSPSSTSSSSPAPRSYVPPIETEQKKEPLQEKEEPGEQEYKRYLQEKEEKELENEPPLVPPMDEESTEKETIEKQIEKITGKTHSSGKTASKQKEKGEKAEKGKKSTKEKSQEEDSSNPFRNREI